MKGVLLIVLWGLYGLAWYLMAADYYEPASWPLLLILVGLGLWGTTARYILGT